MKGLVIKAGLLSTDWPTSLVAVQARLAAAKAYQQRDIHCMDKVYQNKKTFIHGGSITNKGPE